MMNRCLPVLLLFLTLVSGALYAQDATSATSDEVFAPFVSRMRVAVKDPQVRLTWQDARESGVTGYQVYRHTRQVDADTLGSATHVGSVQPGVETFLDTPKTPGSYYYAVLAENADGKQWQVFVPFRNITIEPVTTTKNATQEELAAHVTAIQAVRTGDRVTVTFRAARSGRTLVVFRNTAPITSTDALSASTGVTTVDSSTLRVTDYPVPGVPYYYAVFDSALVADARTKFVAGENVTGHPVEVPLGKQVSGMPSIPQNTARQRPLPYLQLTRSLEDGTNLRAGTPSFPEKATLVPATQQAASLLLRGVVLPAEEPLSPDTLQVDRAAGSKGAAYTLSTIVNGVFAERKWEETVTLMQNLLTLPLSPDLAARAHYYEGQAYYFLGKKRQAALSFLFAREYYYSQANRWLNRILDGK